MATPVVRLRRSATQGAVPTTAQLALGEVAINTYDGKLFIKKNNGTESIVELSGGAASTSASYYFQSNAPSSPNVGDYWIDDTDGTVYIFVSDNTSSQWVEFGPTPIEYIAEGGVTLGVALSSTYNMLTP